MRVFVSSTCYDLIDLRAELYEDLRDLGVEALFSDIKESDFEAPNDAGTNSIESCLVNLRSCDVVILILSQRYGGRLPAPFPSISATHLEYETAYERQIPVWAYFRDRLVADWSGWKKNDRGDDYVPTWAAPKDMKGLFRLIERHQDVTGGDGEANSNNWFWPFANSVDLRTHLRRRLAPAAFRATGEKLIKSGKAPVILVQGQGVQQRREDSSIIFVRFSFDLVNAGTVPALCVEGTIDFGNGNLFTGNDSKIAAVLPGSDIGTQAVRKVAFDVPREYLDAAMAQAKPADAILWCDLGIKYKLPSGHILEDRTRLRNSNKTLPAGGGVGMLTGSPFGRTPPWPSPCCRTPSGP